MSTWKFEPQPDANVPANFRSLRDCVSFVALISRDSGLYFPPAAAAQVSQWLAAYLDDMEKQGKGGAA